jgi:hypothetical protein
MKWPLRQLFSKKYQVNLVLNRLEGLSTSESEESKLYVDLKWKGPKGALGSRFRSMKREKTNALPLEYSGCITWNKEFEHVCVLTNDKAGVFQPWHVYFVLCKVITCMSTNGLALSMENLVLFQFKFLWFNRTSLITLSRSFP